MEPSFRGSGVLIQTNHLGRAEVGRWGRILRSLGM